MNVHITYIPDIEKDTTAIYLFQEVSDLQKLLSAPQFEYAKSKLDKEDLLEINELGSFTYLVKVKDNEDAFTFAEHIRLNGFALSSKLEGNKLEKVQILSAGDEDWALLCAEGLALSNYSFEKYKSEKNEKKISIALVGSKKLGEKAAELNIVVKHTFTARDLVNEPQSYLDTIQYSVDLERMCKESNVKYTKFDEDKIEELGMGGLLAVNQGSVTPPIFNILEYKPANATNKNPIIFVGKGVVYDTGGLSLKPTPHSMDMMKCDMAGSAAVAGAIFAIAENKLPIHVISLIAATDNRPGGDAYAPGDVITMYNGKTVEVLNTDAEGRLTLGDALTYADEHNPELVIDLATLTGAAARAIGKEASVMMGNAPAEVMMILQESGMKTHERLVEFPMYEEYKEDIKSDIADMKNLGGAEAGATTAGIFLQHFVTSPWVHIDIAGTAFLTGSDKYRGKNGTGVGVRLLYQFVKDFYNIDE